MPGFVGIVSKKLKDSREVNDVKFPTLGLRIEDIKNFSNAWVKRSVVDKFRDDKVFLEDEDLFICTEGIILNAKELRNKYSVSSNFTLLKYLYKNFGVNFPSELRGSFSGVIYDKKKDLWLIYTDQIGSKWVFYFFDQETSTLIFGTELKMVVQLMRTLGYETRLCEEGAYFMLTFGYMLDDYTIVKSIKKLRPGSILKLEGDKLLEIEYYKLDNISYIKEKKKEIFSELDYRFRKAVSAEYDKDIEYGYNHIATLSGGLDTRMALFYAIKLGYKNILSITFSQSNYLDEQIAKRISSDWGCSFLFYSLDNGNYLKEIEMPVLANDGLVIYSGAAHQLSMISLISWERFGILHTGELGDAVMGTYLNAPKHTNPIPFLGGYSKKLGERIRPIVEKITYKYENLELYKFYNRGFNGILNGYRVTEIFTEASSPFLHIDFLEYALKIDPSMRYKENIYIQWIIKACSECKKYPWERTGLLITAGEFRKFIKRGIRYVRKKFFGPSSRDSMNPFDYWYKTNDSLRDFINKYFVENIEILDGHSELKEDTRRLFEQGNFLEKTQVLTLLTAIKVLDLK